MILFAGYGDDPALGRAIDAAQRLGIEYLLIDQKVADDVDLVVDDDTGRLRIGSTITPLSDVSAVYARPLSPVASTDPRATARGEVLTQLLVDWLDTTDALVVSRPVDMNSNSSKPFQAQLIAACGFTVPITLITDDPDEVRRFHAEHGDVIFKSISGIRSIVRRLDDGYLARLDRVRVLPTQFQARVPGVDVRVHVVGGVTFATEIISTATDYRYAARDGAEAELCAVTLPAEVAQRCVTLARRLRLPLAGIDLRRTPSGDHVCFEVNPMPGYSYYESHTGQPISDALVELLAGKAE